MAKIDVTKIEGYAEMTPEQKIAAFEAFEFNDGASEIEKLKATVSKANSEAAEWKRKHNALLSDDEKNKAAKEDEMKALREEVETLRKKEVVASHKASFLALGYSDDLASETALAMAENDMAKVFANQSKFLVERDKKMKADMINQAPVPPAGNGAKLNTYEKEIEEARSRGDYASVAAYMRLQSENSK